MNPNMTQVQTSVSALVGVLAGYAAGHNWLGLGLGDWTTILGALVAIGAVVWPVVATRAQALRNTVGKAGDVVLTNRAAAEALPDNPNVIEKTPSLTAVIKGAS